MLTCGTRFRLTGYDAREVDGSTISHLGDDGLREENQTAEVDIKLWPGSGCM